MSIGDDIRQREFRNEFQKAMINILYTNNYLVNGLNEILKDFDITRQQYNVLRILRGQYPKAASINVIRERMLDKMSDASRIVDRLTTKGLVDRKPCDHDKRAADISITAKGIKLLEEMEEPVSISERYLTDNITEEEARTLNAILDKIRTPVEVENEIN